MVADLENLKNEFTANYKKFKTVLLNNFLNEIDLCYCGANFNGDPVLRAAVENLAQTFVDHNIRLIYGGAVWGNGYYSEEV